ncbi:MAG: hypothetical protein ACI9OJ_003122, partial [Myxococcota bacterium]
MRRLLSDGGFEDHHAAQSSTRDGRGVEEGHL